MERRLELGLQELRQAAAATGGRGGEIVRPDDRYAAPPPPTSLSLLGRRSRFVEPSLKNISFNTATINDGIME